MNAKRILALFSVVAVAALANAQKAEEPMSPKAMKATEAAAKRAVGKAGPATIHTIIWEFNGNFGDVPAKMKEFGDQLEKQKIARQREKPTAIVVLLEDPTGKQTFRLAVGVETQGTVKVKEPLKSEMYHMSKAAKISHTGPYEQLGAVHDAVAREAHGRKLKANSAGEWKPEIIKYLNDPTKVPPAERKSELIEPVS